MFRNDKDQERDGEVEWEEDAEDGSNDDEDDNDENADEEELNDSGVSGRVGPKEDRFRDCRCQKARSRRYIPVVYSPLTIEPLPSEPPRPSPARPQAPGEPTSRAEMGGYF